MIARAIFQLAARKLDTKPHETVHIGDNLKRDVWGAKSAGFKAIRVSTNEGRDKTPKKIQNLSQYYQEVLADCKENRWAQTKRSTL